MQTATLRPLFRVLKMSVLAVALAVSAPLATAEPDEGGSIHTAMHLAMYTAPVRQVSLRQAETRQRVVANQIISARQFVAANRVAPVQPQRPRANTSGLNLLSGAQPRQVRPVRVRVIGNGSYICSPAGFGHRSRCYSN
ncbi:hypothetical protein [Rhodophyticola porphyridii]|uniref:hypothetical protein n=1 Tax=Rhodophyticola porphyridii TaxID=1852017 RepID=UPI0035D0F2E1